VYGEDERGGDYHPHWRYDNLIGSPVTAEPAHYKDWKTVRLCVMRPVIT